MAELVRLNYTHDAMIDCIIANPAVTGAQLALTFGYTQAWISQVSSSDGFKARLRERKAELGIDHAIISSVEGRFESLLRQSMDVISEKLSVSKDADLASKTLETTAKALGFGARDRSGGAGQQNNFVVVMPQPSNTAADWSKQHNPHYVVENPTEVSPTGE